MIDKSEFFFQGSALFNFGLSGIVNQNNKSAPIIHKLNQNQNVKKKRRKCAIYEDKLDVAITHSPVMIIADIPATGVLVKIIKRVLPASPLLGQNQRRVLHILICK